MSLDIRLGQPEREGRRMFFLSLSIVIAAIAAIIRVSGGI